MRLLNRREFNGLCVALGFYAVSSGASAVEPADDAASSHASRTVKFPTGTVVPALGQGSWHLGQGRHPAAEEEDTLRTGLSLGMTLIDTSGNYGEGRSEELIKGAIAGQRDRAFVVSKVEADQATGNDMARACDGSLARLGTDYLDLSIYCTGQFRTPNSLAQWRDSKVYVLRKKSVPGAYPTSQSAKWKTYSVFHKGIAARPIRSRIASVTAALSVTYCHGASSMECR